MNVNKAVRDFFIFLALFAGILSVSITDVNAQLERKGETYGWDTAPEEMKEEEKEEKETYEGTNTPLPEEMDNVSPVCKYAEWSAHSAVKLRRAGYGFYESRQGFQQIVVKDQEIPRRYIEPIVDLFAQAYDMRAPMKQTKFYIKWLCVSSYGTSNMR